MLEIIIDKNKTTDNSQDCQEYCGYIIMCIVFRVNVLKLYIDKSIQQY